MGTKRKARKPAIQRVSKTARETGEVVALLRELREKMGIVEEFEPDNRMLQEYQNMRGWVIIELRRIRASLELALHRQGINQRERKIAAEHLHFVALVESEIASDSGGDTAHSCRHQRSSSYRR
jgi:hypothetical protein